MRFLNDDFINRDPRALITSTKLAILSESAIPDRQYIKANDLQTLRVEEDCVFSLHGGAVFKTTQTVLTTSNLDAGSAFTLGKDYCIYICDPGNGNDETYKISLNATYPSGFGANNSRKIGGFHYGKVRKVNTSLVPLNVAGAARGSGWESAVDNGIVPRSVWTLTHRPRCNPAGMVFLTSGCWVDIYEASDNGAGGIASVRGSLPITGTEGLNYYDFAERAFTVGKRLLSYEEWLQMAYGSPGGNNGDNVNAWTMTTNTARTQTGTVDRAVSSVGAVDAVGNVLEWVSTFISRTPQTVFTGSGTFAASDGARAGKTYASGNGHGTAAAPAFGWDTVSPFPAGYGNIYEGGDQSIIALFCGGHWTYGVNAGARCVYLSYFPWSVNSGVGSRGACDSL